MSGDALLTVDSLCVGYASPNGVVPTVRNVSFSINRGEALALVGESGSGKSTIALAILGLLGTEAVVTGGRILYAGQDLTRLSQSALAELRGNRMSIVFQDPFGSLNPGMTIGKQVAEPLIRHCGLSRQEAMERTIAALAEVGLPRPAELVLAYPHQLSGGMQQRVLIAAALICEPELIILDEPTTALDVTIEAQILDLLGTLRRRRNLAMLFISHNLGVVNRICDRTCVLYAGEVLEEGPTALTLRRPRHPYTQGLIGAIPRLASQRAARLQPIPGHLPQPGDLLPGCVFQPRCPHALEQCRAEAQTLRPLEDGQVRCWRAGTLPRSTESQDAAPATSKATQPGCNLVEARNLRKTYVLGRTVKFGGPRLLRVEHKELNAVDGISLSISAGEVLGLVGESGSGKSTLGRCLVRLIDASAGRIDFEGQDVTHARGESLHKFRADVQIVFQNPASSLNPRRTIGATIGRSLDLLGNVSPKERQSRIGSLLESVGLPAHFSHRYPHQLSGGERQRVSIARALASDPKFIICDEPVSALDVSVQATVLNLLADLRDKLGLAYLFISHDLSAVAHIADRIAVMYAGVICEEGPTGAVLSKPNHPYTEALLSAVPTLADTGKQAARIRLREPATTTQKPVTGCRFHHRCPRKIGAICEQQVPPVVSPSAGHRISCHLPLEMLRQPAAGVAQVEP